MTRKPYQDSDEWRQERRGGYGASDAPILVEGDEAAWRQLHGEKLGLLPDREPTETMELGKILEGVILKAGAEREGWNWRRVDRLLRHPEVPYVFASLDGRQVGGKRRPIEVKKWGFKSDAWGPAGSDTVPTSILYQLQQQAAVTGADAVEVLTLFGGAKLERFTVGRDESIIRELLDLEVAAWAFVARGQMPPWPGEQPKRIVLAQDEVPLDDDIIGYTIAHDHFAGRISSDKIALEDMKNALREKLADAGGAKGVLPDGRRVSISHRYPADREVVAWELVAKAYRKAVEGIVEANSGLELNGADDLDLDAIESMFTTTQRAEKPTLRITIGKNGNA